MSNSEKQTDQKNDRRTQLLQQHEYTIREELGRGISGIAFLVTSTEENPYVIKEINYRDVLKKVLKSLKFELKNPAAILSCAALVFQHVSYNYKMTDLDNIKKEVDILKTLNHPFIVDYETSFEDEQYVYIVMEYCAGGDLYKKMQSIGKNGIFNEQQILDWFVQICLALQHLHKKNILHGDIKPHNIFLTEEDYINLGDFGCSKALKRGYAYAKSSVVAEHYFSPEVLENHLDCKSDIWSLGWLLLDLCQLNVWSDNKQRHIQHALSMTGILPSISERYSKELRDLIGQMLSCDPKDRPSADEILAKPFLKDAVEKNKNIPRELEEKFMKETEIFEETYEDSMAFLSEWKEVTTSLEEVHRKCTIGSLSGSVIGAAGGITALVGAILIPFTFGASVIVSAVGIAVGVAGGVTSAASNITNAVKQKTLWENLKKNEQKYKNISKLIIKSLNTLRLLRRMQKFSMFDTDESDGTQEPWWIDSSTFTSLHSIRLTAELFLIANISGASIRSGVEAGVEAGVQTGVRAGVQTGVRTGVQAARAGRAAAAAAEAAIALAAVSGVLSALMIIADTAFIAIDSKEIHQMRQGKINDPKKFTSRVLKGIAEINKMHSVLDNALRGIINKREAIKKKRQRE